MHRIIAFAVLLLSSVTFFSCEQKSDYHRMVERELASGVRHDSLFFGLYLGMTSREFYTHCWELNKRGLIRQGAANTSVYYQIKDFKYPAGMDFYPNFYKDKIVSMPIMFAYDSWAPWNRHLFAENLKKEVLTLMEKWYGPGFLEIKNPDPVGLGGNAFVKVDGNRRISIYNLDDAGVRVDIVDLPAQREMEAAAAPITTNSKK